MSRETICTARGGECILSNTCTRWNKTEEAGREYDYRNLARWRVGPDEDFLQCPYYQEKQITE